MDDFQYASGTIIGTDHRQRGMNNQDAWCLITRENVTVSLVCDGCGSSSHSEVGSNLAASFLGQRILERTVSFLAQSDAEIPWNEVILSRAQQQLIHHLGVLAPMLGASFSQVVIDYFLFTVLGQVITPKETIIFGIGDGVYAVNDEIVHLEAMPGNVPIYLAYGGLIESTLKIEDPDLFRLRVLRRIPTEELVSAFVGTDGVTYLTNAEHRNMPGRDERVGPMSQFWLDDRYFTNPDMIRRKLFLLNRDTCTVDWEGRRVNQQKGLLMDDTTFVVVRRKPEGGE